MSLQIYENESTNLQINHTPSAQVRAFVSRVLTTKGGGQGGGEERPLWFCSCTKVRHSYASRFTSRYPHPSATLHFPHPTAPTPLFTVHAPLSATMVLLVHQGPSHPTVHTCIPIHKCIPIHTSLFAPYSSDRSSHTALFTCLRYCVSTHAHPSGHTFCARYSVCIPALNAPLTHAHLFRPPLCPRRLFPFTVRQESERDESSGFCCNRPIHTPLFTTFGSHPTVHTPLFTPLHEPPPLNHVLATIHPFTPLAVYTHSAARRRCATSCESSLASRLADSLHTPFIHATPRFNTCPPPSIHTPCPLFVHSAARRPLATSPQALLASHAAGFSSYPLHAYLLAFLRSHPFCLHTRSAARRRLATSHRDFLASHAAGRRTTALTSTSWPCSSKTARPLRKLL